MSQDIRVRIALFLGVSALAVPAIAHAQEAGAANDYEDQLAANAPIIVTATKRELTLQDTPVAVTVTSGEEIERAEIRDILDLQTVVPSLRVGQLQSSANTNFFIRGFGNGANNPGIEPSVGVFIDGVYRSRSGAQIADLPDLQRVEVLRGPQSTLFGKNASAGIISIVTREPQFDFGGSAELSYGNYDAIIAKASVTGPVSNTIAVSLAGGINKRDGYIRDINQGTRTNERDRWFVRGQMLFEPNDTFRARLIADYDKIDEVCCAAANLVNGPTGPIIGALTGGVTAFEQPFSYQVAYNRPSTNEIENYGASLQADLDLSDTLALTSISSWRKSKLMTDQDSDFTAADLITFNRGQTDIRTITQELRLTSDFDGPLNFLLGGYYFNEKIDTGNDLTFGTAYRPFADAQIQQGTGGQLNVAALEDMFMVPNGTFFAPGLGFFDNFRFKDEAFSIFAQVDLELTDRLTLTGGVNYTHDEKRASSNTFSTDTFSAVDLTSAGAQLLTQQAIATQVGSALMLEGQASAEQIGAFAAAQPEIFAQIQAGAAQFGQLNAGLTTGEAAADSNPQTVGNPLLALRPLQPSPPFLNFPNAIESGRTSDNDLSYTVRLAYEVSDTVSAYASYATGFKASSFNLSRDSRPSAADLPAIIDAGLGLTNLTSGGRFAGPEESRVIEGGLKGQWDQVSLNFAVFHQEIKGFQSNIFTGLGFALVNAGKQSTFGVEFEGKVKPVDPLTLSLAITWLDPKYDSFPISGVIDENGNPVDLTGTTPAGIPPLAVVASADYTLDMGNGDALLFHGDYNYESKVQVIENVPGVERDVQLFNGSITYAMDMGLQLSVWGRNIFDDRYYISAFPTPLQSGSFNIYPSQPRTYGATVRYRF